MREKKRVDNSKKTRVAKWDNVKFFLIASVVVVHMLNTYVDDSVSVQKTMNLIHLYAMPAFLLIMGLFAKRTIRTNDYGRAFSFLILYFFMKALKFGFRFFLTGMESDTLFTEVGVPWFAFAVFVFLLVTMFLKRFERRYVFVLAVAMGCLAGYDNSLGDSFMLARIFSFYPFFLLGYYLDPDQIMRVTRRPAAKVAAAVTVAAVLLLCLHYGEPMYENIQLLKGRVPYSKLEYFPQYGAVMRLMYYVAATALVFAIIALIPGRRCIFSVMGQRTLAVYALHHYLFIDVFYKGLSGKKLLMELCPEHPILLAVVIGILITFILSWKPFSLLVNAVITPPMAKKEGQE